MAVIGITGASGAPGVTTTAVAWALHSPRPTLLVEADPTGGSAVLAGFLRGTIAHDRSVLAVATGATHKTPLEVLLDQQVQLTSESGRTFIPAVPQHLQARSMTPEWPKVGKALRELSRSGDSDVLVDLGRIGLEHYATSLLVAMDYVVAVTRTDLPSLNTAQGTVEHLKTALGEYEHSRVGVATIPSEREGYSTREVTRVFPGVKHLGEIPWAPHHAAIYSLGSTVRRKRTLQPWIRSVRSLVDATHTAASAHQDLLEGR